ncbi:STAS domain-containing protein [Pinibacter soli]|uniref:STAS domain-containing protein n=1 Tax=Pinibacter soli TaxID=3044211 RepID=A0ABT6RHT5_9BACT|nr:STAS domain-containing protein [Pinibacter soli]MDI3322128.1 STAS domain-containing protein [Pinibacter soli]
MKVKIDTKEKFHVITLLDESIAANMTAELAERLLPYLQNVVKNVVLIMEKVTTIDEPAADELLNIQQQYYDNGASFVICQLQPDVEQFLLDTDKLEMMNVTPTESEAWDIVQMEEIERELGEDGM